MRQKKRHSLLESLTNTGVGFILSYLTGLILFPLMGWNVSHGENFLVVLVYTVLSIFRSYFLRRLFNYYHHRN